MDLNLLGLGICYILINLPCGYLRAGVPKRSARWFFYIHIPIPFLIGLRIFVFKVSWTYIPLLVCFYALGQWGGGKIRQVGMSQ